MGADSREVVALQPPPTERFHHECSSGEDPSTWKTLTDLIPSREYLDIADEIPGEDEVEHPLLPAKPGTSTMIPIQHHRAT